MKKSNVAAINFFAILLTVLVLVIAWQLIAPSYAANSTRIKELDQEISNAQSKLDSLDEARGELSSIDTAFKMISVAVPDGTDAPNLITELEAIALKNGITLPSISITSSAPSEETSSDLGVESSEPGSGTVNISLSVSGGFEQLSNFVTSLEKSVKFLNIEQINYAMAEDGSINLSLGIKAYSRPSSISQF